LLTFLVHSLLELLLPSHHGASIVATHSRIGRDYDTKHSVWDSDDDDDERTYLLPIIADEMNHTNFPISSLDRCRQWFLIAQAYGNVVQLFCLPLGWRHTVAAGEDDAIDEDYGDNSDRNSNCTFYLTTKLVFPQGGSIQDLGFYGDDGKSSLSSGQDSGTGMEGRQKLGVIYHHSSSSVELWMTSYDSCVWQAMPCEAELVNPTEIDTSCTLNIVRTPRTGSTDPGYETMDDVTVSYADSKCGECRVKRVKSRTIDETISHPFRCCCHDFIGGPTQLAKFQEFLMKLQV
jgi:hypothetical protein